MTTEEFKGLGPGDVVRHEGASEAVVVTANYGEHVTAVRSYMITNPDEWRLVAKARGHDILPPAPHERRPQG